MTCDGLDPRRQATAFNPVADPSTPTVNSALSSHVSSHVSSSDRDVPLAGVCHFLVRELDRLLHQNPQLGPQDVQDLFNQYVRSLLCWWWLCWWWLLLWFVLLFIYFLFI